MQCFTVCVPKMSTMLLSLSTMLFMSTMLFVYNVIILINVYTVIMLFLHGVLMVLYVVFNSQKSQFFLLVYIKISE